MMKFRHILVADHDYDVREMLGSYLETLGYRVSACSSGAEVQRVLARSDVDLLIADETMFETGHRLADHARSLGVPTLLMSAYEEIKDSMEGGPRDFIGKPFRLEKFQNEVTRVMAKPKGDADGS